MGGAATGVALESWRREEPRYLAIATILAAEIESGALAVGDRLAGERELCRGLAVSRTTLRRALEHLAGLGMIEPSPGRGWFVSSTRLGERRELASFTELAEARGLEATSKVLVARVRPASLDEAHALAIAPGQELFELRRVRFLNGVALGVDWSRVPLSLAPGLTAVDFEWESLYRTLDRLGVGPTTADYDLEALPASAEEAALLGVGEGEPLLVATACAFDDAGRAVELSRAAYRGDRYRIAATFSRRRVRDVTL
jgi:GntR family transcriptional regulator